MQRPHPAGPSGYWVVYPTCLAMAIVPGPVDSAMAVLSDTVDAPHLLAVRRHVLENDFLDEAPAATFAVA